jgi:TonB-linked SusC/RagA family outer membrane protein
VPSKKTAVEATALPAIPSTQSGTAQELASAGLKAGVGGVDRILKGKVVSDKEEPIPGASVMVKNSKVGTTTDAEGYFSLRVPDAGSVLTIGHVNYFGQEVLVDGHTAILVRLQLKVKEAEEVVVTNGLFKRPKENFTGGATHISGDLIRTVNPLNALEALKTLDPSVHIPDNVQFGSDPNRLPQITLRGTNNFPQQTNTTNLPTSGADFTANYINNPNQPLFILDGFEVSLQKIYDLDINRIASFTILKDAAATSIYGSRASNGVIVVDTKQPISGKLRLTYSGLMQITGPDLSVYDLTNAAEKLEVERLAGLYSTYASGIRPDADAVLKQTYSNRMAVIQKGVNTYWLSAPVQVGVGQRHSLYLEGGDNLIRYGIDLSYNKNTGVMKNSDRTNYSGSMNFSYRYKGLLFKNVLSVATNKATNSNYGLFSEYTKQNPYWTPYDSNGNVVRILDVVASPTSPSVFTQYLNPLYNTTLNTIDNSQYTNFINQTNLEWNIGNGFRLTGRMGITKQLDESDVFLPAEHNSFYAVTDLAKRGSYTKGNGKFLSFDGSLQMDYSKRIGRHQLYNTTGLSSAQTSSGFYTYYVEGFPNQQLDEILFGNAYPQNTKPNGSNNITRRVSAFSNLNYNYDNRYQADFSISTDGSSQFGAKKRFGTFWSTGASWNLHREKFWNANRFINELRLRASVGTTGDNKFQPYMGITTYRYYTDQTYRVMASAVLMGYGNEGLQWQQTLKKNLGLNLAALDNRINLRFDVYREITNNLILDVTLPPSTAFSTYKDNLGQLQNDGYEFSLNAFPIRNEKKGISWSLFVNGSRNRDKILKISNALKKQNQLNDVTTNNKQTQPQYRYQEGESVNNIWAVRSLGIDPSNGRELYVKKDGTITYIWDVADKVVVGNSVPDLQGGFGTSFNWKGLVLGLYFNYQMGGDIYNQTLADRVEDANLIYNVDRRVLLGRWKKPGDVTYFKGLVDENGVTVLNPTKSQVTSRFVQENNYINAESISLSYILPAKLNKRLGLNNTRISFTTNDLKRWEAVQTERGLNYPFARNFTVNISSTF